MSEFAQIYLNFIQNANTNFLNHILMKNKNLLFLFKLLKLLTLERLIIFLNNLIILLIYIIFYFFKFYKNNLKYRVCLFEIKELSYFNFFKSLI